MTGPAARRTAQGEATRARIIDAAADLMFARGTAGTSLDDVLAATGTSKSQLYHYFADKDDLILAVIAHQTDRVLADHQPYLHQLDSLTGLRRWCDAIIALQREHRGVGGCPIGSLASELADTDEPARALLADSFARWEDLIRAGLQAMHDASRLRPEADPAELAAAVIAALEGGLLLTQTTRSTRHLELALAMAVEHVARQTDSEGPNTHSSPPVH